MVLNKFILSAPFPTPVLNTVVWEENTISPQAYKACPLCPTQEMTQVQSTRYMVRGAGPSISSFLGLEVAGMSSDRERSRPEQVTRLLLSLKSQAMHHNAQLSLMRDSKVEMYTSTVVTGTNEPRITTRKVTRNLHSFFPANVSNPVALALSWHASQFVILYCSSGGGVPYVSH